jgi:hypothetical protein
MGKTLVEIMWDLARDPARHKNNENENILSPVG